MFHSANLSKVEIFNANLDGMKIDGMLVTDPLRHLPAATNSAMAMDTSVTYEVGTSVT